MASCTSVVCLPSGSGRYASAYERRGDLLSVVVGSDDASSTYQCGQAVDPQGLPATLQLQLSTLLRSGWTSLVVYVGAAGGSSTELPQALMCTINGIHASLSTVQTYAATVHIQGDLLQATYSGSSRHQGTCAQEAAQWLAKALAPPSAAAAAAAGGSKAAPAPAPAPAAAAELRFSSNLAPGDVRLVVLRPGANQQGLTQLRALHDLLAQLQQVRFGGLTAPEDSPAAAWLPSFQSSHSLLLVVDLAAAEPPQPPPTAAADGPGSVWHQPEAPPPPAPLCGEEEVMLQLLLALAQAACPQPLPLLLQEALDAAGGIEAVQRAGAAGGGSDLHEELARHLRFQCDQLHNELARTHVHYTTLLDRLAGPAWQQNAEALDRAGGGTIHRSLVSLPSSGALLGVGGVGEPSSAGSVRFTGLSATAASRSGSPTHPTLGATSRPGSALSRTARSGSPGAMGATMGGRGGSPDAHTNLLMAQIESLRRALTAAEEREALLEGEALALQEAGSSRVSALMVESKRITNKMAEAKQEAADREAALTAQVRALTEQLHEQHQRLTASAEAARTETMAVAKQLPDVLVTAAGLATGGGSSSRPGSAAAVRPRSPSPSLSPRGKQPYRAPADKDKEDAAAEVNHQLEALLQQQRDKAEALQQQLSVAQGQLARVAGLQEHGVPLMWQCAVTLNQWIAAWQQGVAPQQQLADWRPWTPAQQVLPIHWSPAEAASLQQQIAAGQACSRHYQQLLEAVQDAAAAAAAAAAAGGGAQVLDVGAGGADTGGRQAGGSRPGSAAGRGSTTPRGGSPSPSRLRPVSPHLSHSLSTGKQLPAVAAAAAAAAGLIDPRPAWVLAGRAIGKRPGEGVEGAEGGTGTSDTLNRPTSPAAGQATSSSSRPVSAALSSSSRARPGSAGAVWLAEQEDQVSGALLRRLQQRIEAEVRAEMAAKGAKHTLRLRSEPSSPTAAGAADAVKGAAAAGDAGAGCDGGGDEEMQQYISRLEEQVDRYRQQLQSEAKRSQDLLKVVRGSQAAEGAAASAYMSSMSLAAPGRPPLFTTGYGGAVTAPPPQRPSSAPQGRHSAPSTPKGGDFSILGSRAAALAAAAPPALAGSLGWQAAGATAVGAGGHARPASASPAGRKATRL